MQPRGRVFVGMVRTAAAFAVFAVLAAGCRTPRTEVLVTVESDLDFGPGATLQSLSIRVAPWNAPSPSAPPRAVPLGTGASLAALPYEFGVVPFNGAADHATLVEVRGCGAADCEREPVVVARAVLTWEAQRTHRLRLRLARGCAYVACAATQTCDPDAGFCVDAAVTAAALPDVDSGVTGDARATPRVAALALGSNATCALLADHTATCWGGFWYDRIGMVAGDEDRVPPVDVGLAGVTEVAVAAYHQCAISPDGVMCRGSNTTGELGDGTLEDRAAWVSVQDDQGAVLTGAANVTVGLAHSCARMRDETARCWGANAEGELGTGAASDDPVSVAQTVLAAGAPLAGVVQLGARNHQTCALLRDATVWCWGRGFGPAAVSVPGAEGVAEIAVGHRHVCTRQRDGTVRCFGDNDFAQLGSDVGSASARPVVVPGIAGAAGVATYGFHTCARLADGTARCWGRNDAAQLGDGTRAARLGPVAVRGATQVREIRTGAEHTCFRAGDDGGTVSCIGGDTTGETSGRRVLARSRPVAAADVDLRHVAAGPLGACGVTGTQPSCWGELRAAPYLDTLGLSHALPVSAHHVTVGPEPVPGAPDALAEVALGEDHACARTVGGAVRCWGSNFAGQLSDEAASVRARPEPFLEVSAVGALAAGRRHTCALLRDGRVRCWGNNRDGQLGDGTIDPARTSVDVGLEHVVAIAAGGDHTCALLDLGTLRCWGENHRGTFGVMRPEVITSPVVVAGLDGVEAVAVGRAHACAVVHGGAVHCWGTGTRGQLGDGASPTAIDAQAASIRVVGIESATAIAAGGDTTCAVQGPERRVACWGDNTHGQLGDGTILPRATPVDVGGLSDVLDVAVGGSFACARLRDRTVRCWGAGLVGALGDGQRTDHARPAAVDGLAGVAAIGAGDRTMCAVLDDGTARCWGDGARGLLGTGATSPTGVNSVSGLADARAVSAGGGSTCAVRASGAVVCWGDNTHGQLGDGTTADRLAPVAVSGVANAVDVRVGEQHACALDTAGVVSCWGRGDRGQLGDGALQDRGTPVLVAGIAGATSLSAAGDGTCAVRADGTLRCWGANAHGGLGNANAAVLAAPQPVRYFDRDGASVTLGAQARVALGPLHTCTLRGDGGGVCLGDDAEGAVGELPDPSTRMGTSPIERDPVFAFHSAMDLNIGGLQLGTAPLPAALEVAAGGSHTCVRTNDGAVRCWGASHNGQLGAGNLIGRADAGRRVTGLRDGDAAQLVAGGDYSCVRSAAGVVRCWGALAALGVEPPEVTDDALAPVVLDALAGAVDLSAGRRHLCARLGDGTVRCVGSNATGQRGDGAALESATRPQEVDYHPGVLQLAVGLGHRCAVTTEHRAVCWGSNRLGQLGTHRGIDSDVPLEVPGIAPVAQLAAGPNYTCAVQQGTGRVFCWGTIGDGAPVLVGNVTGEGIVEVPGLGPVQQVVAGMLHTCALTQAGEVFCWGIGMHGALGLGPHPTVSLSPARVNLAGAVELAAGGGYTCARTGAGEVFCWGDNHFGQVGAGSYADQFAPAHVDGVRNAVGLAASTSLICETFDSGYEFCVPGSLDHTCALLQNGTVSCWGAGLHGERGTGDWLYDAAPHVVPGVTGATAIAAGGYFTCAETATGLQCWGDNARGQLLDGVPAVQFIAAVVPLP